MSPRNPYVEALIPNVTVFGDRAPKGVIMLNEVPRMMFASNMAAVPTKRDTHQECVHTM